ncbi:MAG TPA: 50S ribosomal protein L11 methyltransferase, partial [Thermoanaerobaculia bacterium]|nr:50S ribosomal protein L11 methyltransferase [Thermoanaerobaculia bacterium]
MEPPPVPRFLELTPEQREKYFDENGVILRQLDLDPRKLHALLLLTEMVKKGHPSVRSRFTTVLDLTAEQSAAIAQATNRSVTSLALLHTGQNTVYEERWQADFPPRPIGTSFMVVPAARADERFEGRRTIALASDSESAPASFGTGLHATTQASMLLLERWLQPEHRVLDLGTGSGILAAAAGRLGGREILAIDPESEAVVVAERTVAL